MAYGLEVGELVSELGDGGEVVLVAVEDDLGVGLDEVRERGCLAEEAKEEVPITLRIATAYVSANHVLYVAHSNCLCFCKSYVFVLFFSESLMFLHLFRWHSSQLYLTVWFGFVLPKMAGILLSFLTTYCS